MKSVSHTSDIGHVGNSVRDDFIETASKAKNGAAKGTLVMHHGKQSQRKILSVANDLGRRDCIAGVAGDDRSAGCGY